MFSSSATLLAAAESAGLSIAELVLQNEQQWRSETDVAQGMDDIWSAMQA
jgi:L-serine dehydratase